MYRKKVSNAGGETFFEKFRNGLNTLTSEVDKVQFVNNELAELNKNKKLTNISDVSSYYDEAMGNIQNLYSNFVSLFCFVFFWNWFVFLIFFFL